MNKIKFEIYGYEKMNLIGIRGSLGKRLQESGGATPGRPIVKSMKKTQTQHFYGRKG